VVVISSQSLLLFMFSLVHKPYSHIRTYLHAHTCTHIARTHSHTHSHTHTHTHTHTNTLALACTGGHCWPQWSTDLLWHEEGWC